MKKALVLGASGGMGYSIVRELSYRGMEVIAFARTRTKLERLFKDLHNVEIRTGDLSNMEDIKMAAKSVDVIFQAANIPYAEWEEKLARLMKNIVSAAGSQSVRLAIVENIYAYGRSGGTEVKETFPKKPHTKKGKIRLEIEEFVKQSGVDALIAHFPDFYGPNAENSILHYTLENIVKNKNAFYVGDQRVPREFIFTPDGAKAIVNLALNEEAYGQNWNIPGQSVITGEELIKEIREIAHYQKGVYTVSKNMIRLLGLFNRNMREVVEMFYLNEEPVVLNGEKYEAAIGPLPRTSYKEGLRQTISFMKNQIQQ
jgi:nucleoside-diphosphate-sugar epimerase